MTLADQSLSKYLRQPVVEGGVLISLAGDAGYILSSFERSQLHGSYSGITAGGHLSIGGGEHVMSMFNYWAAMSRSSTIGIVCAPSQIQITVSA